MDEQSEKQADDDAEGRFFTAGLARRVRARN